MQIESMSRIWRRIARTFFFIASRSTSIQTSRQSFFITIPSFHAYGHGSVEVARQALESGASELAVASVEEGIVLRIARTFFFIASRSTSIQTSRQSFFITIPSFLNEFQ
jgi:hypothetical protein